MSRPKRREQDALFDRDLADLPKARDGANGWAASRRRSSPRAIPSPRSAGETGRAALQSRRSDRRHCRRTSRAALRLVFVAGGYQFRTQPRFSAAIRAANAGDLRDAGLPELTPTELLAVTAIAYLQPATRAEFSRLAGKEISRDVIGRLKRLDLIDGALRAPEPGAPFAYVTTKNSWRFLGSRRYATFPTSNGSRTKVCRGGLNRTSTSTPPWGLSKMTAKFSKGIWSSRAPNSKT